LAWASVAASVAVADLRGDVDAESAILGNATVIGEDEVGGGVHEITASSSAKEASAPTRNGSGLVRVVKTGLGHADGVDVIGEGNARGKLEERHVVHDQLGVVALVVSHANNTNANHPESSTANWSLLVNTAGRALCTDLLATHSSAAAL